MWTRKRRASTAESRALLSRLKARGWRGEGERDDLLRQAAAATDLDAQDVAWMVGESDAALRTAGIAILRRAPVESASDAIHPLFGSRNEAVRRYALEAMEALWGPAFPERVQGLLSHPDPAVVHAALDWLRQHPSERALAWVAPALASGSPAVRRKAFAIVEATPSPKSATVALRALEGGDEELRFRAIGLLVRFPDEAHIPALLAHCQNDSPRVQDAAIAALTPLLANADARWNSQILPLLTDGNPKVRQLAGRILGTQEAAKVADSFLNAFRNVFGPTRDRAVEGLRALGPQFIRAFLERASDPEPGIAALAASIAVTLRSPEVVPHCIAFLEGKDWWLRDRAAQALAEIRDARALPALLKMLSDPESDISAAAALGVWGDPRALGGLLEAYKKGTKDLRLEILDAFARIPDPRVPGLLESIVKADPDPLVKDKAARLIATKKGESFADVVAASSKIFEPVDFAAVPAPTLQQLFQNARAVGASDLHLSAGTIPHIRVYGRLAPLPLPATSPAQIEAWIHPILSPERQAVLDAQRQLDFCHKDAEFGRFRSNVFFQRKGLNAVFRLVPFEVPSLTDVGLPEALWEITTYSQGLVLVTGASGCGKTTTLAALVDRINETQRVHILTIEDPIEYVHNQKQSLVNQREVPSHSRSFARALRQSLREDPDVILVGEMRDLETISLAITASETGHLVLATLHTTTAATTVDRIINAFPPDQQGQIRMMISDSLKAVISQSLLPRRDGAGRVAAYEILRNTSNVAGLIRDGKTFQIPTAIQTGAASGMALMDASLLNLVQEGTIEPRVAYERALRKEAFEPMLLAEEGGAA
ncbi:MAG: PilT/PilU family type 4a pilus ATPase [Thermoanaerobaculia bacterium]